MYSVAKKRKLYYRFINIVSLGLNFQAIEVDVVQITNTVDYQSAIQVQQHNAVSFSFVFINTTEVHCHKWGNVSRESTTRPTTGEVLLTLSSYSGVGRFLPIIRIIELVCPSPFLKPIVFVARQKLWHLLTLVHWQDIRHLQGNKHDAAYM